MIRSKLLLDCDPGHDDVVAILLAAGDPRLELLAVTAVAGNASCEATAQNACAALDLAGSKAMVAAGCRAPLLRLPWFGHYIHGVRGLNGVALAPSQRSLDRRHASVAMVDMIMDAEPGTISIVATGPLTNVAVATLLNPEIVDRVAEVLIMGGSDGSGNVTSSAEFNFHFDPEAASIVLSQDWRVRIFSLEVTHQLLVTDEVSSRLMHGSAGGAFVQRLLEPVANAYRREHGMDSPPLHDPCPVAYLADPTLFTFRQVEVQIDLTDGADRGRSTFRDHEPFSCRGETNVHLAVSVDQERFWTLLEHALEATPMVDVEVTD